MLVGRRRLITSIGIAIDYMYFQWVDTVSVLRKQEPVSTGSDGVGADPAMPRCLVKGVGS